MGILDSRVLYAPVWVEDHRSHFAEDDLAKINDIVVVPGNWGLSARVELDEGDDYYPIHRDSSTLEPGDRLDPRRCTIITLKRGASRTQKLLYVGDPLPVEVEDNIQ